MSNLISRIHRQLAVAIVISMAAACRDKMPAPVDSSLAQDLASAQRSGVAPTVFNDAPIGKPTPASRAPAAPPRRPAPPRASAPTPHPSPRRQSPPEAVARAPREPSPQPVASSPAPGGAGVIGSGSRVGLNTNGRLCTNNLLPGDKFTATVSSTTMGRNGAVIPVGATVVLEVASVERADPIENSRIEFRVRQIEVNGESYPAIGDITSTGSMERIQQSGGNDRNKVIGGAVAGAVLGKIFGKSTKATVIGAAAGAAAGTAAAKRAQTTDACLPDGSPMRLTLTHDLVIPRMGSI